MMSAQMLAAADSTEPTVIPRDSMKQLEADSTEAVQPMVRLMFKCRFIPFTTFCIADSVDF